MELFDIEEHPEPVRDEIEQQKADARALHEIHRLAGFLRFSPDSNGVYVARCAPDHDILPALAEHFALRFGETPWAIIDEKRGQCLYRKPGSEAIIAQLGTEVLGELPEGAQESADPWEDLWRLYHKSVNNEGRKNLRLQAQFMPKRYRKYLPEMEGK